MEILEKFLRWKKKSPIATLMHVTFYFPRGESQV